MSMVDWYVEGTEYGNCNCDFGCPCQFEALPTHGNCRGFEVTQIEKGHFGEVDLSGLSVAVLYAWPGPIFEGGGELQAIVDERANQEQRHALEAIVHGKETDEAATHWWVYSTMADIIHDTLVKPIECSVDIEARTARAVIPGVVESIGSPICPPHGGGEHRARINIPNGIEFEIAEVGSANTKTGSEASIELNLKESFGQFNLLRHSGRGVVKA